MGLVDRRLVVCPTLAMGFWVPLQYYELSQSEATSRLLQLGEQARFLKSENVQAYGYIARFSGKRSSPWLALRDNYMATPEFRKLMSNKPDHRILCKRPANVSKERRLIACGVASKLLPGNSINYLEIKEEDASFAEPWLYITTAILNSDLGDWFVHAIQPSNKNITHKTIRLLPLPLLSLEILTTVQQVRVWKRVYSPHLPSLCLYLPVALIPSPTPITA